MDKAGYTLEFEDNFDGAELDERRWIRHYLPHWSTWERSAARYELRDGFLNLLIDADQKPWCPEFDGSVRVSSLQTGLFAGLAGSSVGQHRFNPNALVRQGPHDIRLYTPQCGRFEVRAKAIADPRNMVAFWMISFEDKPDRSAEICVSEIFGRDVTPDHVTVGLGVHPFGDPRLVDDFSKVTVPIDARDFHVYAAVWTPDDVAFLVDGNLVKTVQQSPGYPMQLMLSIYEFTGDADPAPDTSAYPKRFVVDYVRGYRREGC
jgi:hypothetical protein